MYNTHKYLKIALTVLKSGMLFFIEKKAWCWEKKLDAGKKKPSYS